MMIPSIASAAPFAYAGGLSTYWSNFVDYWRRTLVTENGVVMSAMLVGALGIFIITRGKWRK